MEPTPTKRARSKKPNTPRGNRTTDATQEQTTVKSEKVERRDGHHYALAPTVHFWTGKSGMYARNHEHQSILQLPLQPGVVTAETLLDHFQPTKQWQVELPLPLYTAPGSSGPTVPDAMVRSLSAKKMHNRQLERTQQAYRKSKSKRTEIDRGCTAVSSAALLYAALLDRDPDPYLRHHAAYNYHYTGGCCAWVRASTKDRAILFKAVGERLEQLEVLQLECAGGADGLETELIPLLNLPETEGPILEIVTNQRAPAYDSSTRVAIRKRNEIMVVREITDETTGSSSWQVCQTVHSTVPFASVCFVRLPEAPSRHRDATVALCTTDYRSLLRLWTHDRSNRHDATGELQCVTQLLLPKQSSGDDWSTVRCVDSAALVACLDRRKLHLYRIVREDSNGSCDVEAPSAAEIGDGSALRFESCAVKQPFTQWTFPCERACALEVAPDDKLIFIATCHHLLVAQLDPHATSSETMSDLDGSSSDSAESMSEKRFRLVVLIVYAHNLQQRPSFLSFKRHSFDEKKHREPEYFLLLAGHLAMCYCLCTFSRRATDKRYVAHHYPYHPRTFADSYKVAQRHGYCLGVSEPLKRRFSAYQSGALLIPFRQRLAILLQNSCGDLLQQTIIPSATEATVVKSVKNETNVAETIRIWNERLLEEQLASTETGHLPYTASNFRKMKKFRHIFNCPDSKTSTLSEQIFRATDAKARSTGKHSFHSAAAHDSSDDTDSMSGDDDESDGGSADVPRQPKAATEQTMEELRSYKDMLVQPLLSVWGYGDTVLTSGVVVPQADQIPVRLPGYDELPVSERIACWMSSAKDECSVKEEVGEGGVVKEEYKETSEEKRNVIAACGVDRSYLREDGVNEAEHVDTNQGSVFSQGAITMVTTPNGPETTLAQATVATAAKKRKYVKGF
ncbi:uncharacterized protein LOC118461303 [Anopheles albimanus]|uniref:uncharacterized protein LOC118461303 n=1 Tax=Anopheles albimanus TaxID=7167 RepID=UPI00164015DC|nr:uncharacterized protein LOC118461303 [Anopheles albimanus]